MILRNTLGEEFSLKQMTDKVIEFVKEDKDQLYRLMVGSDSLYRRDETCFSTVIVVHRVGKGARFFYNKSYVNHDIDIYSKILKETRDSIEIMQVIKASNIPEYITKDNMEIHIDAGANGASKKVMDQCLGYAKGMGYNAYLKPDACAATHVADKYTH